MLFISPHPNYQLLGIVQEQDVYHPANGKYLRTEPPVSAEFFHGGAPSWALDQALVNPRFRSAWNGLPDGVDFRAYVSAFDTDYQAEQLGWDEERKEYVEQFLLNHTDYGQRYTLAIAPAELLEKPWPAYDDTHHMRIVLIAKEGGYDLVKCLEYERKHKNRPQVIKVLEEALVEAPAPDEDLVPA